MRLLVLTSSYPSASFPGAGIFIQRLIDHLPGYIHTTVVTPATRQTETSRFSQRSIEVRCFRYAPRPWQVLANQPGGIPAALDASPWSLGLVPAWALALFGSAVRLAGRHDLIHAHWSVCGVIGAMAGAATGTPVITTLHGSDVELAGQSCLFRFALKRCLQHSARIVTVSSAMADRLQTSWPRRRHKISTIHNGILPSFYRVPPVRPSVPPNEFVFVVIGNLVPSKRVDHIVLAFKRLADSGRAARGIVAGDGPCSSELKRMVQQLGVNGCIDFPGAVPPEAVADLLGRSHALVLASTHEGRSTVVMEAMAAGTAVIATDIDGVRELIEHGRTGLLFDPGDIEALADHMAFLLDRPDRAAALAERARRWVVSQGLTWHETAARYDRIFRQVLGGGA